MTKLDYVIYKITFPNGKIYIGKDIGGDGHSMSYFGSWNNETVDGDFTKDQLMNFSIHKEILFESKDKNEVSAMEGKLIIQYKSNNPDIGYNQTHRPRNK